MRPAPAAGAASSAEAGELRREIGAAGVAATTINIVMGSGLFVIPATMGKLGGWAPLVIAACALVMSAVVLCFAEASSRVPTTGGAYGFVDAALGRVAATVVGGQIWVSGTFAGAAILAAAVDQLTPFAPWLTGAIGRPVLLAAACAAFALIATRGTKESTRAVEITMLVKLTPLLVFLVVVFLAAAPVPSPRVPFSLASAAPLLVLGIYLFAGVESAIGINGEVRNPARNLPIGLFGAIGLFVLLAMAIQLVAQRALGPALPGSAAPLVDAAARAGRWLPPLMAGAAMVSMLGCVGGLAINIPRTIFAFARDGILPAALGRLEAVRDTPRAAILLNAVMVFGLAISGEFAPLAAVASLASMMVYVIGCTAALVLRRHGVARAGPVTAWGITPAAAIVAVIANLAVIASASWSEIAGLAVSVIAFAGLAWLRRGPSSEAVR